MKMDNVNGLRVDRWLWFARFHKTRSSASEAVHAGHVRINGKRVKAGSRVVPGDVLELDKDALSYKLQVLALPSRRRSAAEAKTCYAEDEASRDKRLQAIAVLKQDRTRVPPTRGKPDKRTRRLLRDRSRASH